MKEKLSLRVMIDGNTAFSFRSSSCELVRVVLDFSSVRKKFLMKTSEDPWSFSSKVFWRKCLSSFHVFGKWQGILGLHHNCGASGQSVCWWWFLFGRWRLVFINSFSVFFNSDYFHHLFPWSISTYCYQFFLNLHQFLQVWSSLQACIDVQVDVLFPA